MIVNVDQIRVGVKKYVENELAHKASGITRFAIYFVMPGIDKSVVEYINVLKTNSMFDDMFDENKNIDIERVYERAVFAMEKSGNKLFLQKYGMSLDRTDIDKIYGYIKES